MELLGPRPLRWAADVAPGPCTWDHDWAAARMYPGKSQYYIYRSMLAAEIRAAHDPRQRSGSLHRYLPSRYLS